VHEQAEHFDKVLPLDESISSPVLQNRTTPTTSKQESQSSNVFNVNPTDSSKTVPSLRCPEQMQDANKLNSESSERLVSFGKQPDSSQSQSQEPLSRDTPSRSKFDKYSQTEDSLAPKELEELSREALEHEMRSSPPLSATENHSHSTPAFRLKSTPACSPGRSDPTNNKNSTAAMLPSTSVSERDSTETNKPQPLDSSHLDESTRSIIEETALEGVAPAGTNAAHTGTNGLALIQETSTEEEDDYEEIMKELKAAKVC
jgi:hypothetical protein